MIPVRLKISIVGDNPDLVALLNLNRGGEYLDNISCVSTPAAGKELLRSSHAYCIFIDPNAHPWPAVEDLLLLCSQSFPICLLRASTRGNGMAKIPARWIEKLRQYFAVDVDATLADLRSQVQYALQNCQRYLLKRSIHSDLVEIANEAGEERGLAAKARQTAQALETIEAQNKNDLGFILGLNASQMRALFDETLGDARRASHISQRVHLVVLGAGLLLMLATATLALIERGSDPWIFATGGMGATALIAALVTSPSRRIARSASQLIYVQTAYFSFLTQVRLLNALSPETALQRSERLEQATAKLLEQLKSSPGGQ